MEVQKDNDELLDLMFQPAFRVKDGKILKINQAASGLLLETGLEISALIQTGQEEYREFAGGCLYLSLELAGQPFGASVTRTEGGDIFLLEPQADGSEFQALALAAKELREPLNSMAALTSSLIPANGDEKTMEMAARLSRSLYQMQRILGNMSDAGYAPSPAFQETRNIPQVFWDIFEKAHTLLEAAGVALHYKVPNQDIYGSIHVRQMERAVLNILSNAMKFLPPGGEIHAELMRRGNTLRLQIQDNGPGIPDSILGSIFTRYLRQPGIEDSRHGLGLGMVLVRETAIAHGGTVLIDRPKEGGTRVTMTIAIRQNHGTQFHSPITDLSGGRDQGLIELSQCLPVSVYKKEL